MSSLNRSSISRTPMSERQQMALIMRQQLAPGSPTDKQSVGNSGIYSSPPRTPLRVVNGSINHINNKMTPKTPIEDKIIKKLNKKNAKGETPLHVASIKGNYSLVKKLLKLGASPNVHDNAGWSPLHEACNRGNLKIVKLLIKFGADQNSLGDGKETPLHDAARNGHFKVVKYLVKSGANLNLRNISFKTPFEVANHTDNKCKNPELEKTILFLKNTEENRDSEEGSSFSESEDDETDGDVAKFLGLSNSPGYGDYLYSNLNETPLRNMKKNLADKTNEFTTPPSERFTPRQITASIKTRLTYGLDDSSLNENMGTEEEAKKNGKSLSMNISASKYRRKNRVLSDSSVKKESEDIRNELEESPPKVPPLKIFLSMDTSVSGSPERVVGSIQECTLKKNSPVRTESPIKEVKSELSKEKMSDSFPSDYTVKKRKLRLQEESDQSVDSTATKVMNDIEKYLQIRKQIERRRKAMFPVQPKPPEGFKDYLMNRKTYLLQNNASEKLKRMPLISPPLLLEGSLAQLFEEQEKERHKLRIQHIVEKEKLILSVEQEILRVHGRAARALANQSVPYSVCTILKDEEIYNPIDSSKQEESNKDVRSRYNGRLFLSWLQDVDDKWEKIKEQMILRHHNEAESLNAAQKLDWEWKLKELPVDIVISKTNESLFIPIVPVSDDFDLIDMKS